MNKTMLNILDKQRDKLMSKIDEREEKFEGKSEKWQ